MKSNLIKFVLILMAVVIASNASAHRNGKAHRHPHRVVVAPAHHHHHPVAAIASVIGLAVIIDSAGNAKTESGQSVVVLDSKQYFDGKTEVIEKNGVVYIIN